MNDIAKELPDPTKDACNITTQFFKLVRVYKPSAAEVTHICLIKMRLQWADMDGGYDENDLWGEHGAYWTTLITLPAYD